MTALSVAADHPASAVEFDINNLRSFLGALRDGRRLYPNMPQCFGAMFRDAAGNGLGTIEVVRAAEACAVGFAWLGGWRGSIFGAWMPISLTSPSSLNDNGHLSLDQIEEEIERELQRHSDGQLTDQRFLMGWTFTHREPGISHLDWFRREFNTDRILALTSVGTTLYGAVRKYDSDDVIALVILTQRNPNDWYNFGYKDMDETMGPGMDECPAKILDMLTPIDSQWANEWRARCRANLERRAARPKLKQGMRIRFKQPITFVTGLVADTFVFDKRNRFRRVVPLDFTPQVGPAEYLDHVVYIIQGWTKREYEVVQ